MIRFSLKVVTLMVSLLVFTIAVFSIYHFFSSAPLEYFLVRIHSFNPQAAPSVADQRLLLKQWGLTGSFSKQVCDFLIGMSHGSLGESLWTGTPVLTLLKERSRATLSYGIFSFLLFVPLGIFWGMGQSLWDKKWPGRILTIAADFLFCLPSFSLATFFIFSTSLFVFWIPPSLVYLAATVPYLASLIQQRLAQEEREPYAKAVIAKGLSRRQFYLRHLSRPCLEVTVSILPLWWGLFFGASLVVEPIFRIQGLGFLAVEAFRNQDLPILIGITLVIGGGRIILSNLRELALLLFFPSRKYGHST